MSTTNTETTLRHALSLASRIGERLVEGETLFALGEIEIARGDRSAAAAHLSGALRAFDEMASALWQAKTLILLAQVHLAGREVALATTELRRAAQLLSSVESKEAARWVSEVERMTLLSDQPTANQHLSHR